MRELCKLVNISKIYNGSEKVCPFKLVNLTINSGKFISIQGPSGSGKSTLLYLIGLILNPSSGQIFYNNKQISELSESEINKIRRQSISFISQEFNFIKVFTVKENIKFVAKVNNQLDNIDEKIDYYLNRLNLLDKKNVLVNQLSGGQKRRLMDKISNPV